MAAELREKVLRKKLLYDGYGTYEERKIIQLMKDVAKLYLGNLAEDEFQKLYSSTSKNINVVLANADKSLKISERCDMQVANIEKAIQEQEQMIAQASKNLADLQLELEYVEKLKKISIYPDCVTTEAKIRELTKRKEKLMNQVKRVRQHILTILNSCRELRQVLDDDETTSDQESSKAKDGREVVDMELDRNASSQQQQKQPAGPAGPQIVNLE